MCSWRFTLYSKLKIHMRLYFKLGHKTIEKTEYYPALYDLTDFYKKLIIPFWRSSRVLIRPSCKTSMRYIFSFNRKLKKHLKKHNIWETMTSISSCLTCCVFCYVTLVIRLCIRYWIRLKREVLWTALKSRTKLIKSFKSVKTKKRLSFSNINTSLLQTKLKRILRMLRDVWPMRKRIIEFLYLDKINQIHLFTLYLS